MKLEHSVNTFSGKNNKIDEYVHRIKNGESKDSIFQGIPESWKAEINQKLVDPKIENQKYGPDEIPVQYRGLDSESLDFIWTPPQYIDEEKNKAFKEKKEQVLSVLREREAIEIAKKEKYETEQRKIQELREQLGITKFSEKVEENKEKASYNNEQKNKTTEIYNGMVEISVGMNEELKNDFEQKVQKYTNETISGKDKEYILQGLSDTREKTIEEELQKKEESDVNEEISLAIDNIKNNIKPNLEGLSFDELKSQTKLQYELIHLNHGRAIINDALFLAGEGNAYDLDGEYYTWESVSGEIGKHFDAHGIAKLDQFSNIINLLENGIDQSKVFYTAPFEISKEDSGGVGAGLGTSGGTAYKDGIAVVTSGFKKELKKDGIKHVFLNDVYKNLQKPLAAAFPQYQIHLLSEQKIVLENEAKENKQEIEPRTQKQSLEEVVPQVSQNESILRASQIIETVQEQEREQTLESIETLYTPEQLRTVLDLEIANVNFSRNLHLILEGMYNRYRATNDSIFNPHYQSGIDAFIPELKKAKTVMNVAEAITRLDKTINEMVRNVEYGAFAGLDNREQEKNELIGLAQDFDALKFYLNNDFEYALFEIIGKDNKNPEFVIIKNTLESLNHNILSLIDILYDKLDKLRF